MDEKLYNPRFPLRRKSEQKTRSNKLEITVFGKQSKYPYFTPILQASQFT